MHYMVGYNSSMCRFAGWKKQHNVDNSALLTGLVLEQLACSTTGTESLCQRPAVLPVWLKEIWLALLKSHMLDGRGFPQWPHMAILAMDRWPEDFQLTTVAAAVIGRFQANLHSRTSAVYLRTITACMSGSVRVMGRLRADERVQLSFCQSLSHLEGQDCLDSTIPINVRGPADRNLLVDLVDAIARAIEEHTSSLKLVEQAVMLLMGVCQRAQKRGTPDLLRLMAGGAMCDAALKVLGQPVLDANWGDYSSHYSAELCARRQVQVQVRSLQLLQLLTSPLQEPDPPREGGEGTRKETAKQMPPQPR